MSVGADDRVGVVVPARNAVSARVIGRQRAVSTHHGDELGVRGLAESRTALSLGHVAATDHSPAYRFHLRSPVDFCNDRRGCAATRRVDAQPDAPRPVATGPRSGAKYHVPNPVRPAALAKGNDMRLRLLRCSFRVDVACALLSRRTQLPAIRSGTIGMPLSISPRLRRSTFPRRRSTARCRTCAPARGQLIFFEATDCALIGGIASGAKSAGRRSGVAAHRHPGSPGGVPRSALLSPMPASSGAAPAVTSTGSGSGGMNTPPPAPPKGTPGRY